jgi:hypothetical protein
MYIEEAEKMKDMKSIIGRIIIAFIAFIVIITIYGLKGNTGEDNRRIRQDQDRMVQFVLENIQLKNGEEIEKIKFLEFDKDISSGMWRAKLEINSKYRIALSENDLGEEIKISLSDPNEIATSKEKIISRDINKIKIEYF